jgi:hypothetical protein
MSRIISYKGSIVSTGTERLRLKTNTGKTGYKITKFEIMPQNSSNNFESTVKIYSVKQDAGDAIVNFNDSTLLAAAFTGLISGGYAGSQAIIHDNVIFNQDIFVTAEDTSGAQPTNYYIELEAISLNDVEATMVTLQNLRTITS